MNLNTIKKRILDMSMGVIPNRAIDDVTIKDCKVVKFYIVNSEFDVKFQMPDVKRNCWKKKYTLVNNYLKDLQEPLSYYIFVLDNDTESNILYCNKVK